MRGRTARRSGAGRPLPGRARHLGRARRGDWRSDRGGALVEFALVFPVFIMLAIATLTASLAFTRNLMLHHAAREGARYAATLAFDQEFSSATWAEDVRLLILERSGGEADPDHICVALVNGSPPTPISPAHTTEANGAACSDDGPGDRTRVQVRLSRPAKIEGVLFAVDLTLNANATSHFERPAPPP